MNPMLCERLNTKCTDLQPTPPEPPRKSTSAGSIAARAAVLFRRVCLVDASEIVVEDLFGKRSDMLKQGQLGIHRTISVAEVAQPGILTTKSAAARSIACSMCLQQFQVRAHL